VVEIVDENLNVWKIFGEPWKWSKFKRFMHVPHVMMLHNKNLFKHVGYFNTNFKIVADYELLLRCGKGLKSSFLNKRTSLVRYGGKSVSYKALIEAKSAKIISAKRNRFWVNIEFFISCLLLARYKFKTLFGFK